MILARALAQQARVLLLDEPTAGLDLKYQVEVLRMVRQMAVKKGLVAVLTLHDLNQAALYGDRLVLLSDHSLIASGPPQDVLTAERISDVYGVPVTVMPHPVYQSPMVVPLAGDEVAGDEVGGDAAAGDAVAGDAVAGDEAGSDEKPAGSPRSAAASRREP